MLSKRCLCVIVAAAGVLATAGTASAQFEELSRGLFLAGFRIDAAPNPITKGGDFTTSRSFFPGNNTLSFGIGTLTLNGALTIDGSYARRPIPGVSFGISSSSGAGSAPAPISYTLSIPRAVESLTVTGTATINTSIQVDETGYYHRVTNISNTGTVTTTGAVPTTNNLDFTLGPIDQTGNFFLQGIGKLLDRTDTTTDLASATSGKAIDLADVESLDLNDPEQLKQYINAALIQGITEAAMDPSLGKSEAGVPMMVPEPATLILLVLSGSLCLVGRRREPTAA